MDRLVSSRGSASCREIGNGTALESGGKAVCPEAELTSSAPMESSAAAGFDQKKRHGPSVLRPPSPSVEPLRAGRMSGGWEEDWRSQILLARQPSRACQFRRPAENIGTCNLVKPGKCARRASIFREWRRGMAGSLGSSWPPVRSRTCRDRPPVEGIPRCCGLFWRPTPVPFPGHEGIEFLPRATTRPVRAFPPPMTWGGAKDGGLGEVMHACVTWRPSGIPSRKRSHR